MAADKDTIYIDIDDEITGIIDKVRSSDGKVVALVLPKRASVFQSIVNMKLLKRAAGDADKNLVLVTTESGLMPLAGAAGLHVASSITGKPEIPTAPAAPSDVPEMVEELDDGMDEVTTDTAGDKPVGQLAGLPPKPPKNDEVETVELDNEEPEAAALAPAAAKAKKLKKDKKLQVPNFERFRVLIIIGGLALILLIIGMIVAMKVLPKAVISINTDATSVSVDQNVQLSTTAKSVHLSDGTLPAKLEKQTKTYTQQVTTTGQQNNGNKATGKVTLSLKDCSQQEVVVPAGTGISTNGLTYITTDSATLDSVGTQSNCKNSSHTDVSSSTVGVTAQNAGAKYNASATSYSVSGFSSTVSGSGTTMSGGTDNIVQVVSQSDIDAAKGKINITDPAVKTALETSLKGDNYYPISATFSAATPVSSNSSDVGSTATSVTVTETVAYEMFGIQRNDLKSLISHAAQSQIDTSKQSILDDGVDGAVFNVTTQSETDAQLSMHTAVAAGPQLDVDAIKQQSIGKKAGDVESTISTNPDVTSVSVKFSPFWVKSVPSNTSKITVNIAKPKPVSSSSNAN